MINPNEDNAYQVGDMVDSVGGNFKGGIVQEVKQVSGMTLLKILWENGLIQERSSRIVRKA